MRGKFTVLYTDKTNAIISSSHSHFQTDNERCQLRVFNYLLLATEFTSVCELVGQLVIYSFINDFSH